MFYTEAELWVILYSLISASAQLEHYRKCINDIRPKNIYLTKEGTIKILPYEMLQEDMTVQTKYMMYRQPCYLAPEQMSNENIKNQIN